MELGSVSTNLFCIEEEAWIHRKSKDCIPRMPDRMESRGERETWPGQATPQDLTRGTGKTAGAGGPSEAPNIPGGPTCRFAIGREILRDSLGVTYEAEDRLSRRQVALKQVYSYIGRDPARLDRLVKELNAARLLHHPGIVTIHDLVKEEDTLLYAMEPLGPGDLLVRTRAQGSPSLAEVAAVLTPVCETLNQLHPERVHGTLCARNIVFTPEGAPKLLDFGVAKPLCGDVALDLTRYLAPEVRQGGLPPDPRADLWGLGLTLFEAITGQLPTKSIRSITEIRPDLPASLDGVFRKTICPVEHRYTSVQDFAEALASCAQHTTQATLEPASAGIAVCEPVEPDSQHPGSWLRHRVAALQGWESLEPVQYKASPRFRLIGVKFVGTALALLATVCVATVAILWARQWEDTAGIGNPPNAESLSSEKQEQPASADSTGEAPVSEETSGNSSAGDIAQTINVNGFFTGGPFSLLYLNEQEGGVTGWYYMAGDSSVHFFGVGTATLSGTGRRNVIVPLEDPSKKNILSLGTPKRAVEPVESRWVSVFFGQETDPPLAFIETRLDKFDLDIQRLPYTYFLGRDLNIFDRTAQSTPRRLPSGLLITGKSASSITVLLPDVAQNTYGIGAFMTVNHQVICQLVVNNAPLAAVHVGMFEPEATESKFWTSRSQHPALSKIGNDTGLFMRSETQLFWFGTITLDAGSHSVTFGLEAIDKDSKAEKAALMLDMIVLAPIYPDQVNGLAPR